MYLYIPKGGRSIVVGVHTISSTGMAFPERVAELDAVVGILLELQGHQEPVPEIPQPQIAETAEAVIAPTE